jgi:hypothetical protein
VRQGKAEIKSSLLASSTAKTVSRFTETISTGLTILFSLVAVLFFVLAVIGTVRNYSPVPWLDMWDDYIGFYLRLHAGDWGAWWAQHNEHRIVLARMFFWVDVACFHGNGIFSLVVIYIFALAVGALFAEIWREQSQGQDLYILFFVEAWIFSWTQKQNVFFGGHRLWLAGGGKHGKWDSSATRDGALCHDRRQKLPANHVFYRAVGC